MSLSFVSKIGLGLLPLFLTQCATHSTSLGVAAYSDGIKSRATQASGSEGFLGPLAYPVSLKVTPIETSGLAYMLDYTLLPRKSPEGAIKNTYLIARAPFSLTLMSGGALSFLLGPQIKLHTQKGSGVSQQLNNGGSTAVFGTPSYAVKDALVGIDFGFKSEIQGFLLSAESSIEGFAKSSKLNLTLLIGLTYRVY